MNDKLLKEEILRIKILSEYSTKKTSSENISKFIKEQSDVKVPLKPPAETKKTDDSYKIFYDENAKKYYFPKNLGKNGEDLKGTAYDAYLEYLQTYIYELKNIANRLESIDKESSKRLDDLASSSISVLTDKRKIDFPDGKVGFDSEQDFLNWFDDLQKINEINRKTIYEINKKNPYKSYLERVEEGDKKVLKHGTSDGSEVYFGPYLEKNGHDYIYYIGIDGVPRRLRCTVTSIGYVQIRHYEVSSYYPNEKDGIPAKTLKYNPQFNATDLPPTKRILTKKLYYDITGEYEPASDEEESYIQGCSEPSKVIIPPRDTNNLSASKSGVSGFQSKNTGLGGMDLVRAVNGYEESDSTGQPMKWCAYPYKKNQWIWIPNNSTIEFWDIGTISDYAKQFVKHQIEWGKSINNGTNPSWNDWTEEDVINNLHNLVNFGSVSRVYVGGLAYDSVFVWDVGTPNNVLTYDMVWNEDVRAKMMDYKGLYATTDEKNNQLNLKTLPGPVWEDPRNPVERFIDDFGVPIQVAGAIVLFIAGIIAEFGFGTQPMGLLLMEVALEGLIGIPVAVRSFQKGDNVGGAMSLFLSMTPFLKFTNIFKGFRQADIDSLAKRLFDSGLKTESGVGPWVNFFEGLNPQEQKAFKYFFMNPDPITQKRIRAALLQFTDETFDNETIKILANQMKSSGKIESIPFIKTFTSKEFGLQGAILGLGLAAEAYLGEQLNDQQKKWAEDIHAKVPDELKPYWLMNCMYNGENLNEILEKQNDEFQKESVINASEDIKKSIAKDKIDTPIKENGGTIIPSSNINVKDKPIETLTIVEVQKLKSEGWVDQFGLKEEYTILDWKKTNLPPPNKRLFKVSIPENIKK